MDKYKKILEQPLAGKKIWQAALYILRLSKEDGDKQEKLFRNLTA